jgi:hypothetical protein
MKFLAIPRRYANLEIPHVFLHGFVDLAKHFILIWTKFGFRADRLNNWRHDTTDKQAALNYDNDERL